MQRDDFRTDLPVSRGQWRAIALDALRVCGEPAPTSRFEATALLIQLRDSPAADTAARPVAVAS